MKNILLIGGAGYVGSVITSEFLKLGHNVTVIDNFIYNNRFTVTPYIGDSCYKIFKGDIEFELFRSCFSEYYGCRYPCWISWNPITKKYLMSHNK